MKLSRIVAILYCSLITVSCKFERSENYNIIYFSEGVGETREESISPRVSKFYTGNVKQVHYVVGVNQTGQEKSDFQVDLELTLIDQGTIQGSLITPESNYEKTVDSIDYAKLIDLVESAELIQSANGLVSTGSQMSQILITTHQESVQLYFLKRNDGKSVPLIVKSDATMVEEQIAKIIDSMKD